jgi:hypothetical protein
MLYEEAGTGLQIRTMAAKRHGTLSDQLLDRLVKRGEVLRQSSELLVQMRLA